MSSEGSLDDSLIDSWYWNAIVPPPVHFEDYTVLKRLHQTPNSRVFLVTETETDDRYILKVVDKAACSEAQLSRALAEQWVLGRACANVQFTSLVRSWHDRKHFYFILVGCLLLSFGLIFIDGVGILPQNARRHACWTRL